MVKRKGTQGADLIFGTPKADLIFGRGDADTVFSGGGNDAVFGGSGDDALYGGMDNDRLFGGDGADLLAGDLGRDLLRGGRGSDELHGGAGSDFLFGGSGDDRLVGGSGVDCLAGGSGRDLFIYLAASDSPLAGFDRIADFQRGLDRIDLSAFRGADDLVWNGSAGAAAWGVWFEHHGRSTLVFADTDGDGSADLKIELKQTPGLALQGADFVGVNSLPAFTGGDLSASLAEDSASPTLFAKGTLAFVDPDLDNVHVVSFEPLESPLGGSFEVLLADAATGDGAGAVSWSYSLANAAAQRLGAGQTAIERFSVRVDDAHGGIATGVVALTIVGVNDAPSGLAFAGAQVAEGAAAGTVAAAVAAVSDPDEGDAFGFSLGDDAGGAFAIDPASGTIAVLAPARLDFEAAATLPVTVRVIDLAGAFHEEALAIALADVNERPDAGADFAVTVAEGADDAAILAAVSATDPDAGGGNDALNDFEDLAYAIVAGNDAGLFEIDAATGEISLAPGQSLDFQTAPEHALTVRASDGPGLFDEVVVTIRVAGNRAPISADDFVITNSGEDPFNLPEWALLANDSDPDGDALDIEPGSVGAASGGQALHTAGTGAGGFVTFTDTNGDAPSAFGYRATDGSTGSATARVTVLQDPDALLEGTSGPDILVAARFGSSALAGREGADILFGGDLGDVFDYDALSDAGAGGDVIANFQKGMDDLDLHDLLAGLPGYDGTNAFSAGYLRFEPSGADTLVQVDGDGGADDFATLATLIGVSLTSADTTDFLL